MEFLRKDRYQGYLWNVDEKIDLKDVYGMFRKRLIPRIFKACILRKDRSQGYLWSV